MWSMPKRAESRTRTLRMDGQEWRVEERTDRAADREERYLVFSSNGESLVLRDYHWLWFAFMDEELEALCRSRRKVRELVASH